MSRVIFSFIVLITYPLSSFPAFVFFTLTNRLLIRPNSSPQKEEDKTKSIIEN